jgi:hypothetical protein
MRTYQLGLAALAAGLAALAPVAHAQPGRAHAVGDVQGAKLDRSIVPARGFVDDAMAFHSAGGRLVYVNSDAAELCELEVVDLAQAGAALARIDVSRLTTTPIDVQFAGDGEHFLIVYRTGAADDAPRAAALIDATGKPTRRFGPASDIAVTRYGGSTAVVSYDERRDRTRKGEVRITHTVEALDAATGKRLGKTTQLIADESGYVDPLGFRIQYWIDGYTRAVGVKDGTWDRKEDQRAPDQSATYDLPQRVFSRVVPIADPRGLIERTRIRAEHPNESSFVRVSDDLTGVLWFDGDAEPRSIELAEPVHHYDPRSLVYHATPDGGMMLSLTLDPVNPDAVARKKADERWLDLYSLAPGASKAARRARLLVGQRGVRWIASPTTWAVLEQHIGFSRGGKALHLYRLE